MRSKEAFDAVQSCDKIVGEYSIDKHFREALLTRRLSEKENDTLLKLRGYAEAQLRMQEVLDKLELLTKAAQAEFKDLTETIIPELMEACGVPSIALSENTSIEAKQKVTASMSKEKAPAGCQWLIENGHGAIVKNQVTMNFGVREQEKADLVVKALVKMGYAPQKTMSVHHSTLSAWAREQLENGEELPYELFGIYNRKVSTVIVT